MLTHIRTHWSLVSSYLYPKIRVSYQGYVFSHKDKTCRGIISSMDVVQVILPMCSDRVGRAVVIFDVFQSSVSDVTFPISVMAFHTGKTSDLQECKIRKMRNLRAQPHVNHSKLANNKFKLLPRSNENISLFSFFLSPSFSVFVSTTPPSRKLVCSRTDADDTMLDILTSPPCWAAELHCSHTHTRTDIKRLSSMTRLYYHRTHNTNLED